MPLETATYLSDLVTSNPAHTDGLSQADSHMRLLKSTAKNTFPNITGAVTATHTAINSAVTTVNTTGVSLLASTHAYTAGTSGLNFPDANKVDIVANGATPARFNSDLSVTFFGTVSAVALLGPGATPIGAMVMWLSDTLPSGSGTWAWANGQNVSRTTYAALFAILGTTYGSGDGSTTFGLPNMQEVVPVGKSTMGGAGSPGLLASIAAGVKGVLNGLFGSDTRTIITANLPPLTPSGSVAVSAVSASFPVRNAVASGGTDVTKLSLGFASGSDAGLFSNTVGSASATFTGNGMGGSSTPVLTTQPSRAVNFIIRIL